MAAPVRHDWMSSLAANVSVGYVISLAIIMYGLHLMPDALSVIRNVNRVETVGIVTNAWVTEVERVGSRSFIHFEYRTDDGPPWKSWNFVDAVYASSLRSGFPVRISYVKEPEPFAVILGESLDLRSAYWNLFASVFAVAFGLMIAAFATIYWSLMRHGRDRPSAQGLPRIPGGRQT